MLDKNERYFCGVVFPSNGFRIQCKYHLLLVLFGNRCLKLHLITKCDSRVEIPSANFQTKNYLE